MEVRKSVWYDNVAADTARTKVAVFLEEGQKAVQLKRELKEQFAARGLAVTFTNVETKTLSAYKTSGGIHKPSSVQRKFYINITR